VARSGAVGIRFKSPLRHTIAYTRWNGGYGHEIFGRPVRERDPKIAVHTGPKLGVGVCEDGRNVNELLDDLAQRRGAHRLLGAELDQRASPRTWTSSRSTAPPPEEADAGPLSFGGEL
jgi:hypothetical protein